MTEFLTNIETQEFVYKFLETFDLLYEFLYRAETNKLSDHIMTDIESNNQFPGYESVTIKSLVKKLPGDINVLIEFRTDNIQMGHASFHLLKKNWNTAVFRSKAHPFGCAFDRNTAVLPSNLRYKHTPLGCAYISD